MSEEILINVSPQETRVAIVENGLLQEVHIERTNKRGLVGNIFKGKVSRVLPGMQSAFIDIGLDRAGFLHVSDIVESFNELEPDKSVTPVQETAINTLLREGQQILVQVIKDPLGSKGARLTTRLSLPSRYLVYLPDHPTVAVSQRIEETAERERLQQAILAYHMGDSRMAVNSSASNVVMHTAVQQSVLLKRGGFIVRTAAEGVGESELFKDIDYLYKLWEATSRLTRQAAAPELIYEDLPLAIRTMRDLAHAGIEKIRIDSRDTYERVIQFTREFIPECTDRIEHYTGERPIMDMYSVEDEIQRSLNRRVPLKSGGHIIIDQTEAMTTIDVNTGAFVGHRNHEETIYKTNLEASQVIARQLRLRNLGGIIIIDFIDMKSAEHRRQVLRALEKHLEHDRSRYIFSELTSLGLVQLTRKRTRESLEHILCEHCPACSGRGKVKTAETVCYEIFREIIREVRQFDAQKLLVVASEQVVGMLMDDESANIAELEEFIGKPITLQVEPEYTQEQYDIVPY
jgi:ribonuclease G